MGTVKPWRRDGTGPFVGTNGGSLVFILSEHVYFASKTPFQLLRLKMQTNEKNQHSKVQHCLKCLESTLALAAIASMVVQLPPPVTLARSMQTGTARGTLFEHETPAFSKGNRDAFPKACSGSTPWGPVPGKPEISSSRSGSRSRRSRNRVNTSIKTWVAMWTSSPPFLSHLVFCLLCTFKNNFCYIFAERASLGELCLGINSVQPQPRLVDVPLHFGSTE